MIQLAETGKKRGKKKVYSREKVHRYYLISGKIQIPKHNEMINN